MQKYLKLLEDIKAKGTYKPAAREGMPGTQSLFGYQFRHNLADGFPLLTTKKVSFKNIVTELLWIMKGDTNIKYLVDNGCNIWNQDSYMFYKKLCKKSNLLDIYEFEDFILHINNNTDSNKMLPRDYTLGECGVQYGALWRNLKGVTEDSAKHGKFIYIDQLKDLISGLQKNPMSRRHIIDSWNPATLNDMALNACHCLVQFNCRPLQNMERKILLGETPEFEGQFYMIDEDPDGTIMEVCDEFNIPKYYLDCQMYQRSCDVFLGVPFNIASYALLTEILAKMCNMVAGEYIHTFGDVHIYDNHREAVDTQLGRSPGQLPTLELSDDVDWDEVLTPGFNYNNIMEALLDYNPQTRIKAKLSTGLK